MVGERIWNGGYPLFHRCQSVLSDQRAIQQLLRSDTLSSAVKRYRQLRPIERTVQGMQSTANYPLTSH